MRLFLNYLNKQGHEDTHTVKINDILLHSNRIIMVYFCNDIPWKSVQNTSMYLSTYYTLYTYNDYISETLTIIVSYSPIQLLFTTSVNLWQS